jgi:hypothetical protein
MAAGKIKTRRNPRRISGETRRFYSWREQFVTAIHSLCEGRYKRGEVEPAPEDIVKKAEEIADLAVEVIKRHAPKGYDE